MQELVFNGKKYRLPSLLNDFQQEMYIHLINWKWRNITTEPGIYRGEEYDAIISKPIQDSYPVLYHKIRDALKKHRHKFPFRIHKFFHHMASSQAANVNLFLPILLHENADDILKQLKPDFIRLAKSKLDNGFRIEFWDEPYNNLNDKNKTSGTDSDIAIAYYNIQNELCLWLIEHKLTEKEFTECGGCKSKGRKTQHNCGKNLIDIGVNQRF